MKQTLLFAFILLSMLFAACAAIDTLSPPPTNNTDIQFDKSIVDYSESCYLLDTNYKESFRSFFTNGYSDINITRVELWVYADSTDPLARRCKGITNIAPRPDTGYSHFPIINIDGQSLNAFVKKLNENEYRLYRYAGFFIINDFQATSGRDVILAAYTVESPGNPNIQYGDFVENAGDSVMTLKLIRYRNQRAPSEDPYMADLWELMLKNIYYVGRKNLRNDPSSLSLKILKRLDNTRTLEVYFGYYPAPNYANDKSYLTLTELDKRRGTSTDTLTGPDGIFDFLPGRTIDLENGLIIFPSLRPFSTTLINYGVHPDSLGRNDELYYKPKDVLLNLKFFIKGTLRP